MASRKMVVSSNQRWPSSIGSPIVIRGVHIVVHTVMGPDYKEAFDVREPFVLFKNEKPDPARVKKCTSMLQEWYSKHGSKSADANIDLEAKMNACCFTVDVRESRGNTRSTLGNQPFRQFLTSADPRGQNYKVLDEKIHLGDIVLSKPVIMAAFLNDVDVQAAIQDFMNWRFSTFQATSNFESSNLDRLANKHIFIEVIGFLDSETSRHDPFGDQSRLVHWRKWIKSASQEIYGYYLIQQRSMCTLYCHNRQFLDVASTKFDESEMFTQIVPLRLAAATQRGKRRSAEYVWTSDDPLKFDLSRATDEARLNVQYLSRITRLPLWAADTAFQPNDLNKAIPESYSVKLEEFVSDMVPMNRQSDLLTRYRSEWQFRTSVEITSRVIKQASNGAWFPKQDMMLHLLNQQMQILRSLKRWNDDVGPEIAASEMSGIVLPFTTILIVLQKTNELSESLFSAAFEGSQFLQSYKLTEYALDWFKGERILAAAKIGQVLHIRCNLLVDLNVQIELPAFENRYSFAMNAILTRPNGQLYGVHQEEFRENGTLNARVEFVTRRRSYEIGDVFPSRVGDGNPFTLNVGLFDSGVLPSGKTRSSMEVRDTSKNVSRWSTLFDIALNTPSLISARDAVSVSPMTQLGGRAFITHALASGYSDQGAFLLQQAAHKSLDDVMRAATDVDYDMMRATNMKPRGVIASLKSMFARNTNFTAEWLSLLASAPLPSIILDIERRYQVNALGRISNPTFKEGETRALTLCETLHVLRDVTRALLWMHSVGVSHNFVRVDEITVSMNRRGLLANANTARPYGVPVVPSSESESITVFDDTLDAANLGQEIKTMFASSLSDVRRQDTPVNQQSTPRGITSYIPDHDSLYQSKYSLSYVGCYINRAMSLTMTEKLNELGDDDEEDTREGRFWIAGMLLSKSTRPLGKDKVPSTMAPVHFDVAASVVADLNTLSAFLTAGTSDEDPRELIGISVSDTDVRETFAKLMKESRDERIRSMSGVSKLRFAELILTRLIRCIKIHTTSFWGEENILAVEEDS